MGDDRSADLAGLQRANCVACRVGLERVGSTFRPLSTSTCAAQREVCFWNRLLRRGTSGRESKATGLRQNLGSPVAEEPGSCETGR